MTPARRLGTLCVPAVLALGLAGCGSGGAAGAAFAPAATVSPTGTLTVLAAASLTGPFSELGRSFEAAHPGTTVRLAFGASSSLAQQVTQGAPADVFAAASPATMRQVVDAGDAAGEPRVFVRNRLQIAVPKGNPGRVSGLPDLADEGRTIALCAPQVPCGAAAATAFAAAGLTPAPDTLEQDVKAALAKVRLGEVDAALVYRTDVLDAKGEVEGTDFPEAAKAVNDYPLVVTRQGRDKPAAAAFVDHVLSAEGRSVLAAAGFELP